MPGFDSQDTVGSALRRARSAADPFIQLRRLHWCLILRCCPCCLVCVTRRMRHPIIFVPPSLVVSSLKTGNGLSEERFGCFKFPVRYALYAAIQAPDLYPWCLVPIGIKRRWGLWAGVAYPPCQTHHEKSFASLPGPCSLRCCRSTTLLLLHVVPSS